MPIHPLRKSVGLDRHLSVKQTYTVPDNGISGLGIMLTTPLVRTLLLLPL